MRSFNRRMQVSCLLSFMLILCAAQSAFSQTPSCIKAWVNGVQLRGVTSFNPITYTTDYCIDSSNAIGYIGPGYWWDDLVEIEFWSAVPIASVSNLGSFENDCDFMYETPAETSWGQFTGEHSGYIDFWFGGSSSTMAYGSAGVYFSIADENNSTAGPSGNHVCPPGEWGFAGCGRTDGPRKGMPAAFKYNARGAAPWNPLLLEATTFSTFAYTRTTRSRSTSE